MADLITVEDPDDPRLRDYTGLTDVDLRRKREPAEGLFIAEGEKVIRRAKEAGYAMRSMLLSAKWVDVMRDVIDELPAPVYAVSPELAEQVTGYHVHRGALASMQRKPLPTAADLLQTARRVVIMESVNDHTNIGAIFRSAAALGMDAVLLSPDCADPLYRRSVKVSMGAVFSVPYARLDTWPKGLESVREAGFTLLALTPTRRPGPSTRPPRTPWTAWPSCSAPRATACPPRPWSPPTNGSASPCPTASTPSTWARRRPWPSTPWPPAALSPRGRTWSSARRSWPYCGAGTASSRSGGARRSPAPATGSR